MRNLQAVWFTEKLGAGFTITEASTKELTNYRLGDHARGKHHCPGLQSGEQRKCLQGDHVPDRARLPGVGNGEQTKCRWDARGPDKRLFHELKNEELTKFRPGDHEQDKVHLACSSPAINSIKHLTSNYMVSLYLPNFKPYMQHIPDVTNQTSAFPGKSPYHQPVSALFYPHRVHCVKGLTAISSIVSGHFLLSPLWRVARITVQHRHAEGRV